MVEFTSTTSNTADLGRNPACQCISANKAAFSLNLRYSIRRVDVKFSDQDHCLFQSDGDPKIFKGPNFLSFCLLKLKNTQINLPLVYY